MNAAPNSNQQVSAKLGQNEVYELSQFCPIGELGMGAFGVVKKVLKKDTSQIFAMKVMEKKTVVQRGLQEQLHREVLTQRRLHHENIVSLHYHFEDKVRIYCLLEYADKGQLFSYLRDQVGGLPEQRAGLFFWDSVQALHYLHGLSIMHRDIKPENMLLFGENLIAKVGDFGWCAKFSADAERTTFCGTLDYIPPEMLVSEPHNAAVDRWALGVLLYEMLIARAPFAADSQKIACDLICAVKFDIPANSISAGAEKVIRGLLLRNSRERWPTAQLIGNPWVVKHGRAPNKGAPDAAVVAPHGANSINSSKTGYKSNIELLDPLEKTVIVPRQQTAPTAPKVVPVLPSAQTVVPAPPPLQKENMESPIAPIQRNEFNNNKIDERLNTSSASSAHDTKSYTTALPSSEISDFDLLSSVPDSRIELDDLDNLWNDFASTTASSYAKKQAEKEFGLDGTRRRCPVARPLIGDKSNTLGNDKAEVTTWRSPASGDLPAMMGIAPRAKMRSSRRTKEFD